MKIILNLICILILTQFAHGFVAPTSLKKQVQIADAVARIVVIEITKLEYSNNEEWGFRGLAKCRVITDYTGKLGKRGFVYIPCDYTFDEDPSPLSVGEDCIVCLAVLRRGNVAHPMTYDSVHEVTGGEVRNPDHKSPVKRIPIKKFEDLIHAYWKTKK